MHIKLEEKNILEAVKNIEVLIKEYEITGHLTKLDDNNIYFVIDNLKRKGFA